MAARPPAPPRPAKPAPPDEKFWVRYSQNHELPISGLTSLAWHVGAVVLIVLVAFVIGGGSEADMPIETVSFDPGSGGTPDGTGTGGGGLVENATENELPKDAVRPLEPLTDIRNIPITPADLLPNMEDDADAQREMAKITERGTQSLDKLSKLDKKMRDALMGGPAKDTSGGAGSGPGGDPGSGRGGKSGVRVQRTLRWVINFQLTAYRRADVGPEYVRQLDVLGAMIAVKDSTDELKIIKDLKRKPAVLETEDFKKLNRIPFIDNDPDTVRSVAQTLGLRFVPGEVVALFPFDFEKKLLEKELDFRHLREDQILETRFQILMRPGGTYDVFVTDQRRVGS